jgi:hypothetical protein
MVHPCAMSPKPSDAPAETSEHDAFDPEPIGTLPPGEPATPLSLSLTGLCLLLVAGLFLTLGGDEGDEAKAPATTAAPKKATVVQAPKPAAAARKARQDGLRKRLEQIRRKAAGARPAGNRIQGGR